MRWVRVLVVAGPAVVLAGLGLTHPQELTATTASWWTTLHIILLPIFPLLAVSLWLLLRGVPGPVAWVARIAAYGYATFYSVTDVLVGIGAGELTQFNAERGVQARTVEVDRLIGVGNDLGGIGIWCFLVACAATALALVLRLDVARCQARWCSWSPRCCSLVVGTSTGRPASRPCLSWRLGLACWLQSCPTRGRAATTRVEARANADYLGWFGRVGAGATLVSSGEPRSPSPHRRAGRLPVLQR